MENSTSRTAVLNRHNVFRHWRDPTFALVSLRSLKNAPSPIR